MKRQYGFIFFIVIALAYNFIVFDKIAESDESLNASFLKAIYAKDFVSMDKLLAGGVDINLPIRNDLTPLAEAVYAGDLGVVNYLLKKGAKVEGTTAKPNSPIFFAIFKDNIEIVKRFLDSNISPNYAWPEHNSGTFLIQAVQFGHLDVVQLLVQCGADVNFIGNSDYSPLYRSIIYDRFEIYKFLLSKGACLKEKDKAALSELKWEENKQDERYIELLKMSEGCNDNKLQMK